MESLYEQFCEMKRDEWRHTQLVNQCVAKIQERLPSETIYPELYHSSTWLNGLSSEFKEALKELHDSKYSPDHTFRLPSNFEQIAPFVFRARIFSDEFCATLTEFLNHAERWCTENELEVSRPNTMNRYGAILAHLGLEDVCTDLMRQLMQPVCDRLFPHLSHATKTCEGKSCESDTPVTYRPFDMHHTFVVSYKTDEQVRAEEFDEEPKEEQRNEKAPHLTRHQKKKLRLLNTANLDLHVDDSQLTMSVCLGPQFKGGNLFTRGYRCPEHVNDIIVHDDGEQGDHNGNHNDNHKHDHKHHKTLQMYGVEPSYLNNIEQSNGRELVQTIGYGLFHMGNLRHAAHKITSGARANMIMWCKNKSLDLDLKSGKEAYLCGVCLGKASNITHQKK